MSWLFLFIVLAGTGVRCAIIPEAQCPIGTRAFGSTCLSEEITEDDTRLGIGAECLADTTWESNCHLCRCSEDGVAECLKQDSCLNDGLEPIRCKPNTTFYKDCNTCVCLENGLGLCTLGHCRRSSVPKKSELLSGKECSPGSSWSSQCNDCTCDENGLAVCTDAKCPGLEDERLVRCAPNTMWRKECNTCWCTTNGNPMCTKMGCVSITSVDGEVSEDTEDISRRKQFSTNEIKYRNKRAIRCQPKEEFQIDCNTCKCAPDGGSYACTQNECFDDDKSSDVDVFIVNNGDDHMESHSVCKPSTTFFVSCNACHCNEHGSDYTCTNKPCPLPKDVEVFHELKEMSPVLPMRRGNINSGKLK